MRGTELKDDVPFETLDALRNPGEIEKQVKLQYVHRPSPFSYHAPHSPFIRSARICVYVYVNINHSAQGQGLFTMGLMGFTFAPLQSYSPAADTIHTSAEQHIRQAAKEGKYDDEPGLLEQYEIQIERTKRLAPGCEIVNFPGF